MCFRCSVIQICLLFKNSSTFTLPDFYANFIEFLLSLIFVFIFHFYAFSSTYCLPTYLSTFHNRHLYLFKHLWVEYVVRSPWPKSCLKSKLGNFRWGRPSSGTDRTKNILQYYNSLLLLPFILKNYLRFDIVNYHFASTNRSTSIPSFNYFHLPSFRINRFTFGFTSTFNQRSHVWFINWSSN